MEKILIVILEACDFKSCEVHRRNIMTLGQKLKKIRKNLSTVVNLN